MPVVDYSWARPDPAALRAAGYTGVMRYLSHDTSGKTLTSGEVAALHAAGLDIGLNFEDSPGRPLQGFAAGVADAQFANGYADQLGAPRAAAIYYSCDTDATADQVRPYYQGAKSVGVRPVGAYGGAAVVVPLLLDGTVQYGWVANASSWDHGVSAFPAHLHQQLTPVVPGTDHNIVLQPAYGQWYATGGTDLTPEEHQLLVDLHVFMDAVKQGQYVIHPANGINSGSDIVARIEDAIKAIPQVAANVTVDVNAIASAVAHALGAKLSA